MKTFRVSMPKLGIAIHVKAHSEDHARLRAALWAASHDDIAGSPGKPLEVRPAGKVHFAEIVDTRRLSALEDSLAPLFAVACRKPKTTGAHQK